MANKECDGRRPVLWGSERQAFRFVRLVLERAGFGSFQLTAQTCRSPYRCGRGVTLNLPLTEVTEWLRTPPPKGAPCSLASPKSGLFIVHALLTLVPSCVSATQLPEVIVITQLGLRPGIRYRPCIRDHVGYQSSVCVLAFSRVRLPGMTIYQQPLVSISGTVGAIGITPSMLQQRGFFEVLSGLTSAFASART